jgi:hypothetical protein
VPSSAGICVIGAFDSQRDPVEPSQLPVSSEKRVESLDGGSGLGDDPADDLAGR